MRKDIQHLKLEVRSQKLEVVTSSGDEMQQNFLTAEGIELKSSYSKEDIENLEHIGFAAGFTPN